MVGLRRELVPPPVAGPDGAHLDLIRALATLPPDQRRAIVLYYLADMSVPEIAVFCEVAEGTVKAWLHRARTKLNQVLGDEEVANA